MNNERRKRLEEIKSRLSDIVSDLEAIRDEEQESFDNLPEGLQGSSKGETMQENVNAIDEAIGNAQEAADIEFGNQPDGSLTLLLRFESAQKLESFVEDTLPSSASIFEADSLDLQKVDPKRTYIVSKDDTGRQRLVVGENPADTIEEASERAQEAVDGLDNVQ